MAALFWALTSGEACAAPLMLLLSAGPVVRRHCRCVEGFLVRGLDPILSGCRWLHEPLYIKPAISQWELVSKDNVAGVLKRGAALTDLWLITVPHYPLVYA